MIEAALGAIAAAAGSYYAAEQQHLACLTPEQRAAHLQRRAEERRRRQAEQDEMALLSRSLEIRQAIETGRREALGRLDREPEVVLARRYIAEESLLGEHAERLLTFARDLASRRSA